MSSRPAVRLLFHLSDGRRGLDGHDSEPLSFLECRLPAGFVRRVITVAPGASRPFDEADWGDALVVLESGELDLEGLTGCREHLRPGTIFWLAGLPLRCLRNVGPEPAVLVAISRLRPFSVQ
jgi:hypothetical protein